MQENNNAYSYSEAEIKQYSTCLEVMFTGAHSAGAKTCVYCAEIFRRYHNIDRNLNAGISQKGQAQQEEAENEEPRESGFKNIGLNPRLQASDDEDDTGASCTNVNCARAGWCMCS